MEGGGRGRANKDVHFVVTKRTADDFSLLSYTLLSWDCIYLLHGTVFYMVGKAKNGSLFTNSTL